MITSSLPCVPAITQTIKCSHERSVHLFIDSLLHAGTQSMAYLCGDMNSFSQGLCLSCKKGRCNTLGYHVRQEPRSKSKRLFLVTRAQSPFKGECGAGEPSEGQDAVPCPKGSEVPLASFLEVLQLCCCSVSETVQAPDSNVDTAFLLSQECGHLAAKG